MVASFSRSTVIFLPTSLKMFSGLMPCGSATFTVSMSRVNVWPFCNGFRATTDFPNCKKGDKELGKSYLLILNKEWPLYLTLLWQEASQGSICLIGEPIAISTVLIAFTSSASSAGSRDAAWSLPFQLLSRVTWRSRTFAPSATAATDTWMPVSCPE